MTLSTAEPATAPAATGSRSRRANSRRPVNAGAPSHRTDGRLAWILISPAAIGFLVFIAYPALRGLSFSFTDYHLLSPPQWIGVDNFVNSRQQQSSATPIGGDHLSGAPLDVLRRHSAG